MDQYQLFYLQMVVHDVDGVDLRDVPLCVDPEGPPGGGPLGQDGRVALGARAGGQVHLGNWVRTEYRTQLFSRGKCNYPF